MNLQVNKNQALVLTALLDKYERSRTYKGENIHSQNFSIKPEKVFPEYDGDYTDQDDVNQFNRDMQSLREAGLIKLDFIKGSPVIERIVLNTELISGIYNILGREDITKKRHREIAIYSEYLGIHDILDAFCKDQIGRLKDYKNAKYNIDDAVHILELLETVLNNDKDIMERELSVAVLGDTKLFENSYKSRICRIIKEYGGLELDLTSLEGNEKEKVILEEFHVLPNPSYIFFKGYVEIQYIDGSIVIAKPNNPIAISSEVMAQIAEVRVAARRIITVENLTSYNRVNDTDTTYLYLSGYHNTAKQRFLKKISESNENVKWYHFGDVDPDGYYILKNLIAKTGILFEPFYMGVEQLQSYGQYCKELEKNDRIKAKSLLDNHFYSEVMEYMLKHNCKLEQEIVSWLKGS